MNRLAGIITLVLLLTMAVPFSAVAVELKARGVWRVHANYVKNRTFDEDSKVDTFNAWQRMLTIFEFIANENLKGVLHFEIGNTRWGGPGGGSLNADAVNVKTKWAYLDFKVPGSDIAVKAGIQKIGLPGTYGSHIMDNDVAALAAHVPFGPAAGLTFSWARLYDQSQSPLEVNGRLESSDDEVDAFLAVIPLKLKGFSLNPFGMYSRAEKNSPYHAGIDQADRQSMDLWWAGVNFKIDALDPFTILGDFNYGSQDKAGQGNETGTAGYIGVLALRYKLDMMTPELFFVYESGESSDSGTAGKEGKIMPSFNTSNNGGNFFAPTSFGYRKSAFSGTGADGLFNNDGRPMGVMIGGLILRNMKFMEKLSHDFMFAYIRGNNDKSKIDMFTTEDYALELNFNTRYSIYKNLTGVLELGYFNPSYDKAAERNKKDDAAYKIAAGLIYRF